MADLINFEIIEKLKKECERETALRKSVYPKLIATGKKTKEEAEEQIKLMALAAACFDKILKGKAPGVQQKLFDTSLYQRNSMYY